MKTKKNWGAWSKDVIIYVLDENQEKWGGGGGGVVVYLPPEKTKTETSLSF